MSRSRRPFLAFAVSLLLVGMQYGAQLHALEHVKEALERGPHQSFSIPEDEVCAMCALFAGGASAICDDIDLAKPAVATDEQPSYAPTFAARAAPRFYDGRAPPVFL